MHNLISITKFLKKLVRKNQFQINYASHLNPNIIVLCNDHFVNHENIVLWLTVLSAWLSVLEFIEFLEFFWIFFGTWNILEKGHFFRLVLKLILNSNFFDKIWSPLNQENLKRLREHYLYSFIQGKIDNNLSLSNNNYEQQKFVSFVFII